MAASHRENVSRLANHRFREWLTAEPGDIDTERAQDRNGMRTGWLPRDRADPGRGDLNIVAPSHHLLKKRLGHRAAADVSGADKYDMFVGSHGFLRSRIFEVRAENSTEIRMCRGLKGGNDE